MGGNFFYKGWTILTRRQTNILSAAFVIMTTVVLSQILGLVRQRLLVSIFGASNTLGIYFYSSHLPDTVFQLTISAALLSAFIPVFSEYLAKGKEKEANEMASTLLSLGLIAFSVISIILSIFAPFFLKIFNLGNNFSANQMLLMANLMRVLIIGQLLFIVGTFFTAILQSHNRFFIPGIAAALYNLGIIVGVLLFSSSLGIYSAPLGVLIGALIFVVAQFPFAKKVGFSFRPFINTMSDGVTKVLKLTWPRTLSIITFQLGTLALAACISLLGNPGRMHVIYDFARTLAFAPVLLFGQTIAQAAFPVLSRERERLEEFKTTLITSFNQMLYLVLPISVVFLVLRIPLVRLVFGADAFDWEATVLTGRTLAIFAFSIFSQALTALVLRGFYALHDTKTPLIIGTISTGLMIILSYLWILHYRLGIEAVAIAFSIGSFVNLILSMLILDKKIGGFQKSIFFPSVIKIIIASFFTGFALYIPIKLLDQLVFDTTRTINLILLTGISSFAGLSLYLFLTWLFNVKEAMTFILLFKKLGNWREILGSSEEVIDRTRVNP